MSDWICGKCGQKFATAAEYIGHQCEPPRAVVVDADRLAAAARVAERSTA